MASAKAKTAAPSPHRVVGQIGTAVLGVSCAADGSIVTAGFARGKELHQVVRWSRDGKRLGGFGTGTGVVCWYAETSPDGQTIAAGFGDCTLRLWDVASGKVRTLEKLGGIVASLAWSADSKHLFTGNCGDKMVRYWDVASGHPVAEAPTEKSGTWFVALSPDGKRGVSGASDKIIHIWDPTARAVGQLLGHTGKILALRFSPNGRWLASASQDRTVRLWDMKKRAQIAVLQGHRKQVSGVAFLPSGDGVVSTSSDRTLRLWTMAGEEVRVLFPGPQTAQCIAIAPDGRELIAGCDDGLVRAFAL